MDQEDIRRDIAAFSDDEGEVIVEDSGKVCFIRGGREIECAIRKDVDGRYMVDIEGSQMTYRSFLGNYLAQLHIFASKIISKRSAPLTFVNGPAIVERASENAAKGLAFDLLSQECEIPPLFSSRVVFVTADAGSGKTALLRHYQTTQANAFINGDAKFLFWHVDLQGRQLLRLSEALMGDLGDLRMTGIYMPSIICLIRNGLLILGIDGFDELAAEQGGTDALGALAQIVKQMRERGVIVAASRRSFFDTQDYLKRSHMIRGSVAGACEFDQLGLLNWSADQAQELLGKIESPKRKHFQNSNSIYNEIIEALGGDQQHPLVTKPFLLTHMARALLLYDVSPSKYISEMQNPNEGVASLIQAFIKREINEKWVSYETGEPYLTAPQHMRLLSLIAEEMWRDQKDRLSLDAIEIIAYALFDEWKIPADRKRQIWDMVKMHVLLVPPLESDGRERSFDHPEFRNYFVAYALAEYLKSAVQNNSTGSLSTMLALAQLPDSVARYTAAMLRIDGIASEKVMARLQKLVSAEMRPTFLQNNVGTIVPYILSKAGNSDRILVDLPIEYSSVVLENSELNNIEFRRGTFLHSSFIGVRWRDVAFKECNFIESTFDKKSDINNVTIEDCYFVGIIISEDGEEVQREYAPQRIVTVLRQNGVNVVEANPTLRKDFVWEPETPRHKLVQRLLRAFRRTTILTEGVVKLKFRSHAAEVMDDIIPLMEKHGIISMVPWSGKGMQKRWVLGHSLEEILRADGSDDKNDLSQFWCAIKE